jgi:hypothetical protein
MNVGRCAVHKKRYSALPYFGVIALWSFYMPEKISGILCYTPCRPSVRLSVSNLVSGT